MTTTLLAARPRRLDAPAVRTAILLGAATVTALWAAQVEPEPVVATGAHLAGLLSGYTVLVALLLMARVPAIERGVGADRLARWHALCGRWTLALIAAHAVLATANAAALGTPGRTGALAGLATLGRTEIIAALAGTAALAAVGAMSARAVRRRVSHETWRSVHLLAYLGAALGFFHQPGGPDLAVPVLAWVWTLLHVLVGAVLLWCRCVLPVRQAFRHDVRVTRVEPEGPGVVSIYMTGRDLDALRAEPGQFFRWRFLCRRLWRTALPFSLSAPVSGDTLRITVQTVGGHTRRIRRLRPGTRVLAAGPFGALTERRRTCRKVLLLAGGVGITPMRPLFETMPGDVTLIYRARTARNVVFARELGEIARRYGRTLHFVLGDDRFTAARLRELVPGLTEHDVYVCGSAPMVTGSIAALRAAGVPGDQVHAELFTF